MAVAAESNRSHAGEGDRCGQWSLTTNRQPAARAKALTQGWPVPTRCHCTWAVSVEPTDRKSTRLNSSHQIISYAVFCLKKKNAKRLTHTEHILSIAGKPITDHSLITASVPNPRVTPVIARRPSTLC